VSRVEGRHQPFQTRYLGRLPFRSGADLLDAAAEGAGEIERALLAAGGAAYAFDIGEDIFERVRCQREDVRLGIKPMQGLG
jgi:hypothetical protein